MTRPAALRLAGLIVVLVAVIATGLAVTRGATPGPQARSTEPASSPAVTTPATGGDGTSAPPPTSPTTPAPSAAAPAPSTAASSPPLVDTVQQIESGQKHAEPVGSGQAVEAAAGVSVTVLSVDPVQGVANGPGEAGGPALAVTVRVTNGTPAGISLDAVSVNVYGAGGVAGNPLLSDPHAAPLSGQLATSAAAQGTYVFSRPGPDGGSDLVSISLGAGTTTVLVTYPPKAG